MIKSVLLTRAKELNAELEVVLQKFGYEVLECNLIEYELQSFDLEEIYSFNNLIITSFFAASMAPVAPSYGMNVWTVGAKSAQILESKGYRVQFYAASAEELKRNIPEAIYDDTIYLSSDYITVPMPAPIMRKNFYKVYYKESLSSEQLSRYEKGIDYVLLYSENCAKTLVKLLLENDLRNSLENTTFIVISSKVEGVIKPYFTKTEICQGTSLMLEYLEKQLLCQ
jgi:uroporphyrinogen-III synthase